MYIDTHAHLYFDSFSDDRDEMIRRAEDKGITAICLPNIDSGSIQPMYDLVSRHPDLCIPMMGLHPTSVKENFRDELQIIEKELRIRDFCAVGETGIDLYWDKTFYEEQAESFALQIKWAKEMALPIVIHARESFKEIFKVMDREGTEDLTGVFHSFTGNREEAKKALSYGFYIGINGIITFKNNDIADVVASIPPERIVLETDAPFLAPVPYRGKRNESSYVIHVAQKIAEIHNINIEQLASVTTRNAESLFQIKPGK